jgi:hypothetical protein
VIDWLTGAVSEVGIVLPQKWDAEGILSLFLQITGLSVAHVKERVRVIWGDKAVDFIEKVISGVQAGVAGAEKAIELFQVLRTEGVAGLVRLLKEKIIALKDQALDSIKGALAIEVVAAAIQNLLSLLTPASALVQAVIKIVNIVLFFIQNASRISELVNTIAGGARDVLAGNISGLAAKVESALGRTIPIVIDFFAALIGIGSRIVNTIRKALEFVRGAVDKAIDTVLAFLKKCLSLSNRLFCVKGPASRGSASSTACHFWVSGAALGDRGGSCRGCPGHEENGVYVWVQPEITVGALDDCDRAALADGQPAVSLALTVSPSGTRACPP